MGDAAFDAGWLRLREPVDHASRAHGLADRLRDEGAGRGWSRVVDLGAGAGSNARYLAPRLPWVRHWTFVDHDAALLRQAAAGVEGSAARPTVALVHGDLDREGLDALDGADLVTASALLDLVGGRWLADAVERCAARGCGVLFALSYDGSVSWDPSDPDDGLVLDAVNDHQRRDKGLGAALGPDATGTARGLLDATGYRTVVAPSPWRLAGPDHAPLARALLDGWAGAAREVRPGEARRIDAWADRRRATVAGGAFRLYVGHQDLLALPPDSAGPDDPAGPGAP